jgi:hypothetical protein
MQKRVQTFNFIVEVVLDETEIISSRIRSGKFDRKNSGTLKN